MVRKAESQEEIEIEYVSKMEMKREMHMLQDFAAEICHLGKKQRTQLPVSDEFLEALIVADKIKTKPDAFKRHMRHMAKILLELDVDAIRSKIDFLTNKHQQQDKKNQAFEELRGTLITNGNDEIETLLAQHQGLERQKLRQLVRQAKKEHAAEKPGKSSKALLQYLKEHIN